MRENNKRMETGLYWFSNDLRLADNRALYSAAEKVNKLLCLYIVDPAWFSPNRYGLNSMGPHRWLFLQETLHNLEASLEALGQQLLILYELPLSAIGKLISRYDC